MWGTSSYYLGSAKDHQSSETGLLSSLSAMSSPPSAIKSLGNEFSLFDHLDTSTNGFMTVDALESYWESLGIDNTKQVLSDLGLPETETDVDVQQLSKLLMEEISQYHEFVSFPALRAAIISLQQEVLAVKSTLDNVVRERDKLRTDLQDAKHRTSLIAIEIDEQNARQEKERAEELKITQKLQEDQMRDFQTKIELLQLEAQSKIDSLQIILQNTTDQFKQIELDLKEDLNKLQKENHQLQSENSSLTEKSLEAQKLFKTMQYESNNIKELKLKLNLLENESVDLNISNREELTLKVKELVVTNKSLKDRNDELEHKIEVLGHQEHQKSPNTKSQSVYNLQYDKGIENNSKPLLHISAESDSDLNDVKSEIIKIIYQKDHFCQENKILRNFQDAYSELKKQNEYLRTKLYELDPFGCHDDNPPSNIVPDILIIGKEADSKNHLDILRSSPDGQEGDLLEHSRSLCCSACDISTEQRRTLEALGKEKTQLLKNNQQLQESLNLMNSEFESMENYWQDKLNDERKFYEGQLQENEEQFRELEVKMKEYEELLLRGDNKNNEGMKFDGLSMIDEQREEEEQINVWEQEISNLKKEIENIKCEHEQYLDKLQEDLKICLDDVHSEKSVINCDTKSEFATNIQSNTCAFESFDENHLQKLKVKIEEDCKQLLQKKSQLENDIKQLSKQDCFVTMIPSSLSTNETQENIHHPLVDAYEAILSDIHHEKQDLEKQFSSLQNPMDIKSVQERLGHQVSRCSHLQSALVRERIDTENNIAAFHAEHQDEVVQLESLVTQSQNLLVKQNRKFIKQMEKLTTLESTIGRLIETNLSLTKDLNNVIQSFNNKKT